MNASLNGYPSNLRELKSLAASQGINPDGKDRYQLQREIRQSQARREDELSQLQLECVRRGLETGGSVQELKLRLEQHQEGTVSQLHRKIYKLASILGIVLGIAALGVSLPHIASELMVVMGISFFYACLLALVIDGGIVVMKLIDTLAVKFNFPTPIRVTVWMLLVSCLVMSAALNGSQFCRHSDNNVIAIFLAVFLSLFVFSVFFVGSTMAVFCQDKTEEQEASDDPATQFRKAALQYERLQEAARKFQ